MGRNEFGIRKVWEGTLQQVGASISRQSTVSTLDTGTAIRLGALLRLCHLYR